MVSRTLTAPTRSFFLFGPRQTGKSTFVRSLMGPDDLYVNLLPQREFLAYAREPGRFRDTVLAHLSQHRRPLIVVDEVQRLPDLLDEVHDLVESTRARFALTGSSARKLRRGAANLLAGRASTLRLFPLTSHELGSAFDLERALSVGCLPHLWGERFTAADEREFLSSYAETYLGEEIQAEGVVRSVPPFARFLDIAAANDGQSVNFTATARDCGVSSKTVQEYYQILEDTFVAWRLSPWTKSARKRLVAHPRYYLFDVGVTNALAGTLARRLPADVRGRRFEQLVFLEISAAISYGRLPVELFFWRTTDGQEVDLVLARAGKIVAAIEVKSIDRLEARDWRNLLRFREGHHEVPAFVLVPSGRPRALAPGITAMRWTQFLEEALPGL